jgi:hypothetical protein
MKNDLRLEEEISNFRFPLTRTLPLLGSFLFLLLIVIGGFAVGGYHPVVTVLLWLGLIGSGWFGLSDLLTQAVIKKEGLQVRSLSLRGVQTRLIPWDDVQELSLSGHVPDVLQLLAHQGVSQGKWTLPAHMNLAQEVVKQAHLEPHRTNQPPQVPQAFDKLRETKGRSKRYLLHWQWKKVERELEDE